ncbi:MAG TPA: hypothetical protein DCM28_20880 [Phycisphaerales bacterium]|nr:hypothetical protein [Phycisphaerales bacterium]HCD31079.1 hypothetical protein [Phycisphaerales bacterium]|tara:strand:+ start:323 stop:754 length:432 start_codon:yes stop_codon:yes gene_type:complete
MSGKPPSLMDKYVKSPPSSPSSPPSAPTQSPPSTSSDQDDKPVETQSHTIYPVPVAMIDVQWPDGGRIAWPYQYLRKLQFVPDSGIVLTFSEESVLVRGYRLLPIYHGLLSHRIGRIAICSRSDIQQTSSSPMITDIDVVNEE